MLAIPSPSWLLLLWCGFAAALASELLAAAMRPARSARRRGEASSPQLMTGPRENVAIAVTSGTLVFAPIYAVLFECVNRAELLNGAIFGAAHGLAVALITIVTAALAAGHAGPQTVSLRAVTLYRARRALARTVYGAVFGFLYVVPAPPPV